MLPIEYHHTFSKGIVDKSTHNERVCDICAAILNNNVGAADCFAFVPKEGVKPLNLAVDSASDRAEWMAALNTAVEYASGTKDGKAGDVVHREGWLRKEDPSSKTWRPRYFVLDGRIGGEFRLWYLEMHLRGTIDLQGGMVHMLPATERVATLMAHGFDSSASSVDPVVSDIAGLQVTSGFPFRFHLSNAERVYQFAADSEADMNFWLSCLQLATQTTPVSVSKPLPTRQLSSTSMAAEAAQGSNVPEVYQANLAQSAPCEEVPSSVSIEWRGYTSPPYSTSVFLSLSLSLSYLFFISLATALLLPCVTFLFLWQVTFVFTDVQNSTNLWATVPDAMDASLEAHDTIMRTLLTKFRGYEVKTEGDAFMVSFFSAIDAILWCLAVQEALVAYTWPDALLEAPSARREVSTATGAVLFAGVRVRMGIHTGHPNCRRNPVTARMDYFGPVVNRTARLSDSAHGGQVVCTQEVFDLLKNAQLTPEFFTDETERAVIAAVHADDCGNHPYKGIQELVRVFQLSTPALRDRQFPALRTGKE
jgi:class 3 adenylate cyclase